MRIAVKSSVRVSTVADGAQLEGERKTVTALFADIKGSTELEQDLDPEEARAIVDPALKLMIDAVRRLDGGEAGHPREHFARPCPARFALGDQ
jgi:class 3 adenylate cyclase